MHGDALTIDNKANNLVTLTITFMQKVAFSDFWGYQGYNFSQTHFLLFKIGYVLGVY